VIPCAAGKVPVRSDAWFEFVRAGMTPRTFGKTELCVGSLSSAAKSCGMCSRVARWGGRPSTTTTYTAGPPPPAAETRRHRSRNPVRSMRAKVDRGIRKS
jgi:hypothetical protein